MGKGDGVRRWGKAMGQGDGARRWGKAMGQGEAQACVSRRHKTVRCVCAKALVLGFKPCLGRLRRRRAG